LAGVANARSANELKIAESSAGAMIRKSQAEAGRSLGLDVNAPAGTFNPIGSPRLASSPAAPAPPMVAAPVAAAAPVQAAKRLDDYVQNSRFVAGKNFFQNGAQWVDADAQKLANAKAVQLKFGSPEYFAFYAKNTAARPWLALGRQVQFVHAGTLYEVVE
jgi:hypothetical protein